MAQMPPQPQGSPSAPQGPQDPSQEGAEDQKGGDSPSDLIVSVNDGLSKLVAMLGKAQGADPMAVKAITTALSSFQSGVQTLLGKGGSQAVPAAGMDTMEAGGSDKAVPAM